MAVDGLPTEMLESGHVGGEGLAQHQRIFSPPSKWPGLLGAPGSGWAGGCSGTSEEGEEEGSVGAGRTRERAAGM